MASITAVQWLLKRLVEENCLTEDAQSLDHWLQHLDDIPDDELGKRSPFIVQRLSGQHVSVHTIRHSLGRRPLIGADRPKSASGGARPQGGTPTPTPDPKPRGTASSPRETITIDETLAQLRRIAANFRRGSGWATAVLEDWYEAVHQYPQPVVEDAVTKALREMDRCPALVDILRLAHDSNNAIGDRPKGCRDCGGTGWRRVAWAYWHTLSDGTQVDRVEVRAAGCSCDKGQRMGMAPGATHPTWAEYRDRLHADPRTIHAKVETAADPLTLRDTMTDEEWAALEQRRSEYDGRKTAGGLLRYVGVPDATR